MGRIWTDDGDRRPCDGCRRVHRGPRCKPTSKRSRKLTVTLPAHVHLELVDRVPWGERSAFVSRAIEAALEPVEAAS